MVSYEVAPGVGNASNINHFQRLLIPCFKCFSPGTCPKQSKSRSGARCTGICAVRKQSGCRKKISSSSCFEETRILSVIANAYFLAVMESEENQK